MWLWVSYFPSLGLRLRGDVQKPRHSADLLNPVRIWAQLPGPEVLVHAAPDFPGKLPPVENGLVAWSLNIWRKAHFLCQPGGLLSVTLLSCPVSVQLFPVLRGPEGSVGEGGTMLGAWTLRGLQLPLCLKAFLGL